MLELGDVTLCCVDTVNHSLALRALDRSRQSIQFARVLLLTHGLPPDVSVPKGIEIVPVARLDSRAAYSEFILKSLLSQISSQYVLLVQWDGYVVNPDAWDASFLKFDYIGAQWEWESVGMRVGNGGFSLRSRRLLEALQDPRIVCGSAEDVTICRTFRPLLESDFAICFADEATADLFAFEAAYPTGRPFGFHGLYNFCRIVPEAELATLAANFSNEIASSPQLAQLLRNCFALGYWTCAIAIARRILLTRPEDGEVQEILARAEANEKSAAPFGRNAPCPCGSGRRFKHCHGALNGLSTG